jgi:predicted dithiol-disulfide oxidoreductase (DUF899 family)
MSLSKRTVTREEWIRARKALLAQEKAFTHDRDALTAARSELPMVKIDKPYVFEDTSGRKTLAELFDGKPQLVIYHFMFAPEWNEGCRSCSFVADNFASTVVHFAAANTAFAAVSRAPAAKLDAFKKRMGWTFRWFSSAGSDFNYDFHVSFTPEDLAKNEVEYNYSRRPFPIADAPGLSVFLREGDAVFHTYSTYERGLDILIGAYNYLDLTPLGRQEPAGSGPMPWVRLHDRYVPSGSST